MKLSSRQLRRSSKMKNSKGAYLKHNQRTTLSATQMARTMRSMSRTMKTWLPPLRLLAKSWTTTSSSLLPSSLSSLESLMLKTKKALLLQRKLLKRRKRRKRLFLLLLVKIRRKRKKLRCPKKSLQRRLKKALHLMDPAPPPNLNVLRSQQRCAIELRPSISPNAIKLKRLPRQKMKKRKTAQLRPKAMASTAAQRTVLYHQGMLSRNWYLENLKRALLKFLLNFLNAENLTNSQLE